MSDSSAPQRSSGSGADGDRGVAALGSDTAEDRFGIAEVLRIVRRSLPLLSPVLGHLALFVTLAGGASAVVLFVTAAVGFDALWQGVLQGESIRAGTARILGLDPALLSQTDVALSPELRREVRDRLLWGAVGLVSALLPCVGALYYYHLWILQRVNQHLRTALLARLQALSLRFHAQAPVGDSIYRVYQDSAMVTNVISGFLLFPAVWFLFAALTALQVAARIDVGLVSILALALPPSFAVACWLSKRLRRDFRKARETNSALTSRIQEIVAGLKLIKTFGVEEHFQRKFERDSREAFDRAYTARSGLATYTVILFWICGSALLYASLVATQYTMAQVVVAASVGAAALQVWNLGVYYTFSQSGGRMSQGIERLFELWARAQDIAVGLDRVFEMLDRAPEVQDAPGAVALGGIRREIRFPGVSFGYRPEQPVLREIELCARLGTITALVGPTGAGKTTLVCLLLRLYDPDRGRIEIDGVDLRALTVDSVRSQVSIALQENVLFGATVRDNIRYAKPTASDEQIREVARIACAHDFITRLPQGYDTLLGERGSKLSTGQRQRISIARALLKDTPVLILDEPTAALDVETELALMKNLALWGKGRAIFLITHRASTLAHADQIVVLREGRIVEHGTHHQLLAGNGSAYRRWLEHEATPAPQELVG